MNIVWHPIDASLNSLEEGIIVPFFLGTKKIAVLKYQHTIYAFSEGCPHAGESLCKGYLDNKGQVVCQKHHYRFDPATGRNTSGEGYKLKTYPVKQERGIIFIGNYE